jgi:hypothetical protein
MKLIFTALRVLFILAVGYFIGSSTCTSGYYEAIAQICDVDTVNNSYTVNVAGELFNVETELPLPQSNKEIIIILPK